MRFLLLVMILLASATSKTMDVPQNDPIDMKRLFAGTALCSEDLSKRSQFVLSEFFQTSLKSVVSKYPQLCKWDHCVQLIHFINQETDYPDSYIAENIVAPVISVAKTIHEKHMRVFIDISKYIKRLIEKDLEDIDVNFSFCAAIFKDLRMLAKNKIPKEALKSKEIEVFFKNDEAAKKSYLCAAVAINNAETFKLLLDKGATPNIQELFLYGSANCLKNLQQYQNIKLYPRDLHTLKLLYFSENFSLDDIRFKCERTRKIVDCDKYENDLVSRDIEKIKILLILDKDGINKQHLEFFNNERSHSNIAELECRAALDPFESVAKKGVGSINTVPEIILEMEATEAAKYDLVRKKYISLQIITMIQDKRTLFDPDELYKLNFRMGC